jgi:ABC-type dipeptide/oligopeptide/nickel transport system permease component
VAQQVAGSPGHDAGGVGHLVPAFALGMLLMQVFSVKLGWLPTVGADTWRHYILPSLTLGAAVAA